MGKGDIKTRRGKIHIGSYGVKRPHNAPKKASVVDQKAAPKKTVEKKSAKKTEKK